MLVYYDQYDSALVVAAALRVTMDTCMHCSRLTYMHLSQAHQLAMPLKNMRQFSLFLAEFVDNTPLFCSL